MIYTLGHRENYLLELAKATEKKPLLKTGWHRRPNGEIYPGGSVWETPREVWAYIDSESKRLEEYSVFEIDAQWDMNTLLSPNSWRCLAHDSQIIKEIPRRMN